MVVKTARTSEKAAEGQNGTLEFILVNHPLDCPVCDKGGECPLQDLTFRYGPGNTRMSFEKLTFEKPIPISPAISLDRERCILCYRCTRFSEDVSEDGQLVARNRGALSVITTFEDEPYSGPFTGNVTELCPVGALLPTQYRFEARPWEIQNVPTVCGMCSVGCNINATVREGKVKRILSRNHPEVDEGWICDKGRFGFTHLRAGDRIVDPIKRVRARGFEPVSWDDALDEAERLLRAAQRPRRRRALRIGDGRAGVRAREARARRHSARTRRCCRRRSPTASTRTALPLSAIARRAGRRRARRRLRRGARADRRPLDQGRAPQRRARRSTELDEKAVRERRPRRPRSGRAPAAAAARRSRRTRSGSASPARTAAAPSTCPTTPNGRGVADAWAAAADEEPAEPESVGLLIVSGDEAANDPNVRALAEKAESVIAVSMFHGLAAGWADLVLPGNELPRARRHVREPRRPAAAAPPLGDAACAGRARVARRSSRRASASSSRRTRRCVFAELSERIYGGLSFGEVGERAPLRALRRRARARRGAAAAGARGRRQRAAARLLTSRSSRAPRSSASRSSSSSGPRPRSSSRAPTRSARGIANGRRRDASRTTARRCSCARASRRTCAKASCASRASTRATSRGTVGGERVSGALVDLAHQGVRSSSTSSWSRSRT